MVMLGASCSPCCSQPCECAPEFLTVDVADEDRLGIHEPFIVSQDLEWASQAQTSNGLPLPQGFNSLRNFRTTGWIETGNNQNGGHFACGAPSSFAGMCMRLTRPRLLAFRDAIRGSYQLTRASSCKDYVYVNTAPCDGNFIRSLTLSLIEDTTVAYGTPTRQSQTVGATAASALCAPTFSTYPSQGKTGWIEYRMSAEVCIAGDAGNKTAVGCDGTGIFQNNEDTNPLRCNCYPDTIAIQRVAGGPYIPGPCTYNGSTCYASITLHSVGSFFPRTTNISAFNIVGTPYGALNSRAMWSEVSGSVPSLTNPTVSSGNRWCEIDNAGISGATVTGDVAAYAAAKCFQIPRNMYFGLFTRSTLSNVMLERTHWDSFGFGVRVQPNASP